MFKKNSRQKFEFEFPPSLSSIYHFKSVRTFFAMHHLDVLPLLLGNLSRQLYMKKKKNSFLAAKKREKNDEKDGLYLAKDFKKHRIAECQNEE